MTLQEKLIELLQDGKIITFEPKSTGVKLTIAKAPKTHSYIIPMDEAGSDEEMMYYITRLNQQYS